MDVQRTIDHGTRILQANSRADLSITDLDALLTEYERATGRAADPFYIELAIMAYKAGVSRGSRTKTTCKY